MSDLKKQVLQKLIDATEDAVQDARTAEIDELADQIITLISEETPEDNVTDLFSALATKSPEHFGSNALRAQADLIDEMNAATSRILDNAGLAEN